MIFIDFLFVCKKKNLDLLRKRKKLYDDGLLVKRLKFEVEGEV